MSFFYINLLKKLNLHLIIKKINFSFEFFPPKSTEMEKTFWLSLNKLQKLNPIFISLTYGANTNKPKYITNLINKIKFFTKLTIAPHITCINTSPTYIKQISNNYWSNGIRHIIALRGDLPSIYKSTPYCYSVDMVIFLKKINNFFITVAAYPELHPESPNFESDLINFKTKVVAGANSAITQFFFYVVKFLKFSNSCISSNINIVIIPGILPIINFNKLKQFLILTNVKLSNWIFIMFYKLQNNLESIKRISTLITIDIIRILVKEGVRHIHFYTINNVDIIYNIFYNNK